MTGGDGPLTVAVVDALRDAGRLESWQASAAVACVRRLERADDLGDTLSGVVALHRELRATMAEALKGAAPRKSSLRSHRDEVAARRAKRGV